MPGVRVCNAWLIQRICARAVAQEESSAWHSRIDSRSEQATAHRLKTLLLSTCHIMTLYEVTAGPTEVHAPCEVAVRD